VCGIGDPVSSCSSVPPYDHGELVTDEDDFQVALSPGRLCGSAMDGGLSHGVAEHLVLQDTNFVL